VVSNLSLRFPNIFKIRVPGSGVNEKTDAGCVGWSRRLEGRRKDRRAMPESDMQQQDGVFPSDANSIG
jgi:hypothetical protein